MELVFKLRNLNQFRACLQSMTDPTSPSYGKFLNSTMLTPYLPTPGQRASIIRHLTTHGFNVTAGPSPLVLRLSGTVGTIERGFGVKLAFYQENVNRTFYAANSDPQLPQNLAALVTGIQGLDNYTTAKPAESPCSGPYCPQGIQAGYSLSALYPSGYNGASQKVAIVDAPGDPSIQTAINTYSTQYGLPAVTLDIRYPDGVPSSYDPGWASETAMDVEAVHATAPGAGIVLLYLVSIYDDPMNAVDYVATNHPASIVSNSWTYGCATGSCSDTQLSSSFVSSTDSRLAFDAAQGLTILFASGDSGAKPDGSTLGTEFPSSDPNVLAVGATNLVLTGCGTTTCSGYSSESGASISGGGYSGAFAEPSWQTNTIGTKSGRAVPDVSMLGYIPGFWVYSTISGGACYTSKVGAWYGCAGTSLSTPLWAGFLAIVLQIRGGVSMGNIGPKLYQLASSPSYLTYFHDVTSGSNKGYSAGSGWDPVTGWGTPIASNLAWALAGPPSTSPILSSPSDGAVISSTTPTLSWTSVPGATFYMPEILSGSTVVWRDWPATTSFPVPAGKISFGQTYSWLVYSANSEGYGPQSAVRTFTVQLAAPTLISPSNNVVISTTTPTLCWNGVQGASFYMPEIMSGSTVIWRDWPGATCMPVPNGVLNTGQTYSWLVYSANSQGYGQASVTWTFTVAGLTAPTPVSPSNGAVISSTSPTLCWTGVTGASFYMPQIFSGSNLIWRDWPATTCFTVPSGILQAAQTYTWNVYSANSQGYGPASQQFTFSIGAPPAPILISPVNGATTSTTPTFTWTASTGASYYMIEIYQGAGFVYRDWPVGTTYTVPSGILQPGLTYQWRVIPGTGSWSYGTPSTVSAFTTS